MEQILRGSLAEGPTRSPFIQGLSPGLWPTEGLCRGWRCLSLCIQTKTQRASMRGSPPRRTDIPRQEGGPGPQPGPGPPKTLSGPRGWRRQPLGSSGSPRVGGSEPAPPFPAPCGGDPSPSRRPAARARTRLQSAGGGGRSRFLPALPVAVGGAGPTSLSGAPLAFQVPLSQTQREHKVTFVSKLKQKQSASWLAHTAWPTGPA